MSDIFYFVFQGKTVFLPLKSLYPQCMTLIQGEDQLYPLKCMEDTCHRDANCADVLAHRVHYFFEKVVPGAELLVAYYKWTDRPNSIRAGLFHKNMSSPRVIVCNRAAFTKFQDEGIVYQWTPPNEFLFMGGTGDIVPVEGLIRD